MTTFTQYSDILLDGFVHNTKPFDVISKKQDLLQEVLDHYDLANNDILFVGFSPWCLGLGSKNFNIASVSPEVLTFLDAQKCAYTHIDLATASKSKKYSVVIAADEYFTFADSDQGQRDLVNQLAAITADVIITTLRDYKNQDFKDREFSQPIMIRGNQENKIYLEHYNYSLKDKNSADSKTYVINDSNCATYGPFARRNMYFKQLAKFSIDAGASNFYVHKNLMYKSIIKKNYEHVITIKF